MLDDLLTSKDYQDILNFQTAVPKNKGDFVKGLLATMHQMFHFDTLSFFQVDHEGNFCNPKHINFGDQAIQVYTEHFFKGDPFYFKNLNLHYQNRDSTLLNEVIANIDFYHSEYYVDFFNKFDFGNEVGLYIKNGNQHIGAMGVMRCKGEQPFNRRDQALLNTLANIISYQYYAYTEWNRMLAQKKQLEKALAHYPVGVVIIDTKFNVINYNETAYQYCKEISHNVSGCVVQRTVMDCLQANSTGNSKAFTGFQKGGYVFEMIQSSAHTTSHEREINNYIIYITPQEAGPDRAEVKRRFSLTNREIEVIEQLGQGLTNKQIADKLYISPQTVRTHVENIMIKTDANNRTDILYKVGKIK